MGDMRKSQGYGRSIFYKMLMKVYLQLRCYEKKTTRKASRSTISLRLFGLMEGGGESKYWTRNINLTFVPNVLATLSCFGKLAIQIKFFNLAHWGFKGSLNTLGVQASYCCKINKEFKASLCIISGDVLLFYCKCNFLWSTW